MSIGPATLILRLGFGLLLQRNFLRLWKVTTSKCFRFHCRTVVNFTGQYLIGGKSKGLLVFATYRLRKSLLTVEGCINQVRVIVAR